MPDYTVNEDMGAFEAAYVTKPVSLHPPHIERFALALDRTNQDATCVALARAVARHTGAEVCVVVPHEGPRTPEHDVHAGEVAKRLGESPDAVKVRIVSAEGEHPAQQILHAAKASDAAFIVLPAPFLRDYDALREESAGSTVDILMVETKVPLLFVRQPLDDPAPCLANMLIPVSVYAAELGLAASYAFSLVAAGGTIEVLAVPDEQMIEQAKELLGDALSGGALTPEALARAEQKEVGPLVGAIQKLGTERGLQVTATVRTGNMSQEIAARGNAFPRLICTGSPSNADDPIFHRVQRILLHSKNPVLVV